MPDTRSPQVRLFQQTGLSTSDYRHLSSDELNRRITGVIRALRERHKKEGDVIVPDDRIRDVLTPLKTCSSDPRTCREKLAAAARSIITAHFEAMGLPEGERQVFMDGVFERIQNPPTREGGRGGRGGL